MPEYNSFIFHIFTITKSKKVKKKNTNALIGCKKNSGTEIVRYLEAFSQVAIPLFASIFAHKSTPDSEEGQLDVDGYYVQLDWVITGESPPYKAGVFKRVKPSSPKGAWEVIARFEDGDGKYSDVGLAKTDGEQTTLGVNYYANKNVLCSVNYLVRTGQVNCRAIVFELDWVQSTLLAFIVS